MNKLKQWNSKEPTGKGVLANIIVDTIQKHDKKMKELTEEWNSL